MVKIGNHPTSPQTAYPRIHSLHAFDGRLYLSYGDYNDYPAMVIVAYDPVANQFRLEESASSDSVGYFRAAGRFGSDLRPPAPVLQSLGNAGRPAAQVFIARSMLSHHAARKVRE
jgi:hypothetical protein